MFLSSTIYHSMAYGSLHKYILRIIDHSMIYIAIAGSYTPVALSLVSGWLGYVIIVLQWGITLLVFYTKFLPNALMKNLALSFILSWVGLLFLSYLLSFRKQALLLASLCY